MELKTKQDEPSPPKSGKSDASFYIILYIRPMEKVFVFGISVLLFISCNRNKNDGPVDAGSGTDFDAKTLPKVFQVNEKASNVLKNWPEFTALETGFEAIYKAENKEDLGFAIDNVIELQNLLDKSEYPEAYDIPQIKSRQKVFKTYILKVKASLEDRTETMTPTLEMVNSYNAMRNQFNVVINNTLDTNLILDE
ncbi:MAG: hypothetical protein WBG90_03200 [Saonia sp.]